MRSIAITTPTTVSSHLHQARYQSMASMSSSISSLSSSIFSLSSNGSTESSFSGRTHIEAFQESFSDTLIGLCAGRDAKLRIKRRRALKYFQSLPSTPESSFSSGAFISMHLTVSNMLIVEQLVQAPLLNAHTKPQRWVSTFKL